MKQQKRRRPAHKKPTIRLRPELFWDVDPKTIDLEKNARYVIERIAEFGNDNDARWMTHYYSKRKIKNAIQRARGVLHPSTKEFWRLILK